MTRNFKVFGLALMAAFAMSATVVMAASAQSSSFTADEYPAHIDGTDVGTSILTAFGSALLSCTETNYHGTLSEASGTLTVKPTFAGCTSAGGSLTETVTTNGCDYAFSLETHVDTDKWTGGVTIECPTGNEITVDYYHSLDTQHQTMLCQVHIPPQHLTGVTFTVETGAAASEDDLRVEGTIEGIEATKTEGHPEVCPKDESTTEAKYDLDVTLQGTNELEESVGLRVSTD